MLDLDTGGWIPFTADVAGVKFSGRPFDYESGFYVRTVAGLLDGGTISVEDIPRSYGPGTLLTAGRRSEERAITIAGFAYGVTQIDLAELADQFGGILTDERDTGALSFQELGAWRHVIVARGRASSFSRRGRDRIAPYALVLRAPDQRIYGDAMETSGWGNSCQVIHRGRYPAPVVIEVRGSVAGGYTITGPGGSRVVVTAPLTSGAVHRYDSDDASLLINGVPQGAGLSRADRLEAPHGEQMFTVSAGAELRVIGNDTYNP